MNVSKSLTVALKHSKINADLTRKIDPKMCVKLQDELFYQTYWNMRTQLSDQLEYQITRKLYNEHDKPNR